MSVKSVFVVAAVIVVVGVGAKLSQNIPDDWKHRHALNNISKKAKSEGKTAIVIPGPIVDYAGFNIGLGEALKQYSVVVAEPLEAKTEVSDSDHIMTWYRCQLYEPISMRPPMICDSCPVPRDPPAELKFSPPGEFVLSKIGGTALIDGVQVTMTDSGIPELKLNQRYVMFVSLMPNGVALPAGGPAGVFRLENNETLSAVTPKTRLSLDVQRDLSSELSKLRKSAHR
jgi:hypothetical protein